MRGERLAWFRVASHLHIPVEELAQRITETEFLDWLSYLNWLEERQSKEDHYLAAIAAEVRRSYVKSPRTVKTKDFLLSPARTKNPGNGKDSKSVWLNFLKVKEN